MTPRTLHELLYDSEASHRLVDRALHELNLATACGLWLGCEQELSGEEHPPLSCLAAPERARER